MAIAYVNSPTPWTDDGSDYSSKPTGSFNCTTGNLIIVPVWWADPSGSIDTSGVTDTAGNTYVATGVKVRNASTGKAIQLWYAKNITGNASNIVTATLTVAERLSVMAAQYSGLDTTSPLDQTPTAGKDEAGTTSALATGSFTTTQADELIFQLGAGLAGNPSVGSGYTSRGTADKNRMGDKIVSAIQTGVTSAMTAFGGSNDFWSIQAATFKMAGGGGGSFAPKRKILLGVG